MDWFLWVKVVSLYKHFDVSGLYIYIYGILIFYELKAIFCIKKKSRYIKNGKIYPSIVCVVNSKCSDKIHYIFKKKNSNSDNIV